MPSDDPRDPRNERRSVIKSLDQLAQGFDAFISNQKAVEGERQATMREIGSALTVLSTVLKDVQTTAGGSSALPIATAEPGTVEYVNRMRDAAPGVTVRNTAQEMVYQRRNLFDYSVDPTSSARLGAQTRTSLRQNIFNNLAARAQDHTGRWNEVQQWATDPQGNRVNLADGYMMDRLGRIHGEMGRFVNAETAAEAITDQVSPSDLLSMQRRMAFSTTASNVARQWNSGQPVGRALMSALPGGALKAAGIAGAVAYGGDKLIDWTQGQAAINREYMGVYGGGQLDQLDDRAERWWNRNVTGRFSLLGGENYDRLFKAGMNLGLRGSDRSQFIGVGADIMGQTGASSEFTTGIMSKAIEAGLGLDGLAESIKNVSDAAKDAGINANRAREIFQKNFEAGADIMWGTPGARQFAEYTTLGQLNQARPYQNVNQVGAQQNINLQSLFANQAGMKLTDYMSAAASNPGAAIAQAEGTARDAATRLWPHIPDLVQRFMSELGEPYRPEMHQQRLGRFLLDEGDILPNMAMRLLNMYGYNVSEAQALGVLGQIFTEESAGNVALRAQADATTNFSGRPFETERVDQRLASDYTRGKDLAFEIPKFMTATGRNVLSDREQLQYDYYQTVTGKEYGQNITAEDLQGKTRRPILEQLIASKAIQPGKTKVSVITKDGRRVISLEEALRDFPDQLENGTATFVEGIEDTYLGQSTTQMLGVPTEITNKIQTTSSGKEIDYGEDYDQYIEDRDKDRDKKKGDIVVFGLTAKAQQLLEVVNDEGQYYDPNPVGWDGNTSLAGR